MGRPLRALRGTADDAWEKEEKNNELPMPSLPHVIIEFRMSLWACLLLALLMVAAAVPNERIRNAIVVLAILATMNLFHLALKWANCIGSV